MAEESSGSSQFGFLTRKAGPLPVWGWLAIALAAYVWYTRFGPGKTAAAAAAPATPAVDPVTGEPYAQELGAADQQLSDQGSTGSGTAAAGGYATNDQWATAAINYLVGLGVDPTVATQAVENFLNSQPNTVQQQADVNTAEEGIGPPPQTPGPAAVNPVPVAGSGGTPAPAPAAGQVTVPNVRNMQVNEAVAKLEAAGLKAGIHQPRNDKDTYAVDSETPPPGTKVAKGSTVDLGIKPQTFSGEKK